MLLLLTLYMVSTRSMSDSWPAFGCKHVILYKFFVIFNFFTSYISSCLTFSKEYSLFLCTEAATRGVLKSIFKNLTKFAGKKLCRSPSSIKFQT